nr:MAG TPA: GTP Cyclohydrolase I [Caudoviricetes sp.]
MPNTPPRSYNDIKKLAGEVPAPVPIASAYKVTEPVDENRRRDLEIQAPHRSLNAERAARYRVEHKLERLGWTVAGMSTACLVLSLAGLLAIASTH